MLKVIVVEDEEIIRRGIVLGIDWAELGCVVVGEAKNGEEGLLLAQSHNPSLIITDLKMPHMDGIEMLQLLRERGNRAFVIILTAYSSFEYARSALRLGAVDFLLKPFHDGELEKTIIALRRRIEAERASLIPPLPVGKSKYVLAAIACIREQYAHSTLSIGMVAEELGISEGHLSHIFKRETGDTLMRYLTVYRIGKARDLLRDCRLKVYEVAEMVGYKDISYFSSTFKKITGYTPSEYFKP